MNLSLYKKNFYFYKLYRDKFVGISLALDFLIEFNLILEKLKPCSEGVLVEYYNFEEELKSSYSLDKLNIMLSQHYVNIITNNKIIFQNDLYSKFVTVFDLVYGKYNYDFDILIIKFYYKKINFIMEKNELKKQQYKKHLLISYSEDKFSDFHYYKYPEKIGYNHLIIQTYKYSFNKKPNDFFTRISTETPKYK